MSAGVHLLRKALLQIRDLGLEASDVVLESSARVGARTLNFILHRLEVSEQVGEVCALLAQRGILVNQARFDALLVFQRLSTDTCGG